MLSWKKDWAEKSRDSLFLVLGGEGNKERSYFKMESWLGKKLTESFLGGSATKDG